MTENENVNENDEEYFNELVRVIKEHMQNKNLIFGGRIFAKKSHFFNSSWKIQQ